MQDVEYVSEIHRWRASLEAEIRRDHGPIALVGLFWLQKGVNTVGSSRDCSFCLPRPAPRLIGAFDFDGKQLKFRADLGQSADFDGAPVAPGAGATVRTGHSPSRISLGEITIIPIQLGERMGLQAWDRSRLLQAVQPIRNWFEVDRRFRLNAAYTPYPAPVKIGIPDSLGQTRDGYAQGYVSFKLDNRSHNLDVTETEDGRLFLQFRDASNGLQTYAEGRYLLSDSVAEDGSVAIDFNRAYNPQSAFSPYMPSTIVPRSYVLRCQVDAGEKLPSLPPEPV